MYIVPASICKVLVKQMPSHTTAYTTDYNCSISVTLGDCMYFNLQSYWTDGHTHTHTYMTEELYVVSKKCICEFQIIVV